MTLLPDCMMPDGAEPCIGYNQLNMKCALYSNRCEELERRVKELEEEANLMAAHLGDNSRELDKLEAERDRLRDMLTRWKLVQWDMFELSRQDQWGLVHNLINATNDELREGEK